MGKSLKVLVVGCGNMGASHALVYHKMKDFSIVGLVSRNPKSRERLNSKLSNCYQLFSNFEEAIATTKPDVVSINTYPDTHAEYAIKAFGFGAHVFVEKPLATTAHACKEVVRASRKANKKLVVGYILRHHPSWIKFIDIAKTLGKPLVMRMNLNQQSEGEKWQTHKNLLKSASPIIDCGVHYVDVMCQMTKALPVRVSAIGARLSGELTEGMYNYGQLQIEFADGSVGWYEAGWGPMISETAFFVKDVIGPNGSVSIVATNAGAESQSDNIEAHTKAESLRVHSGDIDKKGLFVHNDKVIDLNNEPTHYELCRLEQEFLLKAIIEDLDLTEHLNATINSMKIVLAADESIKSGKAVEFS